MMISKIENRWKSYTKSTSLPETVTQRELTKITFKTRYSNFKSLLANHPRRSAAFLATNGSGLSMIPGENGNPVLTTSEFRNVILAYLQIPLKNQRPPPHVTNREVPNGHSAPGCYFCCSITERHNSVCETIATSARQANIHGSVRCAPKRDAMQVENGRTQEPADIFIGNYSKGFRTMYLDVTIVDPLSAKYEYGKKPIESIYLQAADSKIAKYKDAMERIKDTTDFNPLVFSAYGRVAPASKTIMERLVSKGHVTKLLNRISLEILKYSGAAYVRCEEDINKALTKHTANQQNSNTAGGGVRQGISRQK